MKCTIAKSILLVLSGAILAILVAILIPFAAPANYSVSKVWLDREDHVGWRTSEVFGQQWIDIDRDPFEPVPVQKQLYHSVGNGLAIPAELLEKFGARARFLSGEDRPLPVWIDPTKLDPRFELIVVAQGWPWKSLYHYRMVTSGSGAGISSGWIALWPKTLTQFHPPLRELGIATYVRWPQMLANVGFTTAILWLLFAAPGFVRRRIRARRGQCPACAYPIGSSTVCTECGAVLPLPQVEDSPWRGEGRGEGEARDSKDAQRS